jgi:glutamyl-tRNA synthetase
MSEKQSLSKAIFPITLPSLNELEAIYPIRNLPVDAMVTRFAPSPTGFLHTGSLFASLVSWRFAKQSNGVFFVRLEDTDQKREITGSAEQVLEELEIFGITPDESFVSGGTYGPYKQSERKILYHSTVNYLLETNNAYPCFCTHDELSLMRSKQEAIKVNTGYYGEFATCRKLTEEESIKKINDGEPFVVRFRSNGDPENKIKIHDLIRGHLELTENDQDIVIMKGDGLPTYHFAHLVDDHFMRTTHITRGEEWLPSLPIHLELFDRMGWNRPLYAHLPVIMKLEDGRRRKLSKRKDEEAAVQFFLKDGYPIEGILEYLMTIANTNFEEWRLQHPLNNIYDFNLSFDKMTLDGALFDLEKVKSISKEQLSLLDASTLTKRVYDWAKVYDKTLERIIESDQSYFTDILSIERGGEKPRKDYEKFSDILPIINFMYDDYFNEAIKEPLPFNERFGKEIITLVLDAYLSSPGLELAEELWFDGLKELAVSVGFSSSVKEYKKNKDAYLGHVGDFAEIVRIAVSGRKNTPNFYYVLKIMGVEKINNRINKVKALI